MTANRRFGTDGVRGEAGLTLTAQDVLLLGQAAGRYFTSDTSRRHMVVVAKDPRLSGYMIEPAIVAGFASAGMDVSLTGPLPTPAVSMLVPELRADAGVMITASHNQFADNGIKLFGPKGSKLTDVDQRAIEHIMGKGFLSGVIKPDQHGRVKRIDEIKGRYVGLVKQTFPRALSLHGLRIVIDCANGAAYEVAPQVLYELGADVVKVGTEPNGLNINENVGSMSPAALIQKVKDTRADIGIALDGDGDRVLIVDERGDLIDGDQIMAIIAPNWKKEGRLAVPTVVGTVLSNLALERYLTTFDITLARSSVGDRYVLETMRETGSNLGGEESGHVIFSDYVQTGDGLVAALQVIAAWLSCGPVRPPLSAIAHPYEPLPVVKENIKPADASLLERPRVRSAIAAVTEYIGNRGRLIVRASGTEPVVRVMLEGERELPIQRILSELISHMR